MSLCFPVRLLSATQVSYHIDQVFYGFLRSQDPTPIYTLRDIFAVRSNCTHLRTCPVVGFALECASKVILLVLISYMSTIIYSESHDNPSHESSVSVPIKNWISIMFVASVLYKIGQLQDSGFKISFGYEVRG